MDASGVIVMGSSRNWVGAVIPHNPVRDGRLAEASSLVEELGQARILSSDMLRNYPESRLHRGRQEGWINEENRQSARWMFVFARHVILPGEVDVPVDHVRATADHGVRVSLAAQVRWTSARQRNV